MSAITEAEVRAAAIKALSQAKSGFLTTTELIEILEVHLKPTGVDAEFLDNRSDTYFSQKVRNLVSHRNQGTGLEARGLAQYDRDREGWAITELGLKASS